MVAHWCGEKLKDFIEGTLGLPYEEINRVSTAGQFTGNRLKEMLDESCMAFLIMTGEDEQADGSLHARENVIHEAGLFQGRLGFERAIILLEDDCKEFSNIHGLIYIPFPKGKHAGSFRGYSQCVETRKHIRVKTNVLSRLKGSVDSLSVGFPFFYEGETNMIIQSKIKPDLLLPDMTFLTMTINQPVTETYKNYKVLCPTILFAEIYNDASGAEKRLGKHL